MTANTNRASSTEALNGEKEPGISGQFWECLTTALQLTLLVLTRWKKAGTAGFRGVNQSCSVQINVP